MSSSQQPNAAGRLQATRWPHPRGCNQSCTQLWDGGRLLRETIVNSFPVPKSDEPQFDSIPSKNPSVYPEFEGPQPRLALKLVGGILPGKTQSFLGPHLAKKFVKPNLGGRREPPERCDALGTKSDSNHSSRPDA